MEENRKLIIGISSRALFNLDESHDIYEKDGLDSYRDYQIANEDKTLILYMKIVRELRSSSYQEIHLILD